MNAVRINDMCAAVVSTMTAFWLVGIHVNDGARILFVLIGLLLLKRLNQNARPLLLSKIHTALLTTFIAGFILLSFLQPILQVYLGVHGIDFALFAQVADSIARHGAPSTSLLGTEWRSFFGHHFEPFLYLPGALSVFMPSFYALGILHGLAITGAAFAFMLIARRLQFSRSLQLIFVALLFANPTFREGVFFGVHDDIFALPFLGFAYYFWLEKRRILMTLCLLAAASTKESMFAVVSAFGAMMLFDTCMNHHSLPKDQDQDRGQKARPWLAILLMMGAAIVFFGYVFMQPLFFAKTFDHAGKIVNFADFIRMDWLSQKLWATFFLGLPFLWIPLWRKNTWHLLLPILPLIGMMFASRFDEMWKPMNYYGVAPTYLIALASLIGLHRNPSLFQSKIFTPLIFAFLFALAFSFGGRKPIKTVYAYFQNPSMHVEELEKIPSSAHVITNPSAAIFLFRVKMLTRIWIANQHPDLDFDYIVVRPGESKEIASIFLDRSEVCFESNDWIIRCKKGGTLNLN